MPKARRAQKEELMEQLKSNRSSADGANYRDQARMPVNDANGYEESLVPVSNLKCLGSLHCSQYQTTATFYVEPAKDHRSLRHLVVLYENGRPQFRAGIPDEWSEADLMRHVMVEGDENNA
jgi:hypothetical protein